MKIRFLVLTIVTFIASLAVFASCNSSRPDERDFNMVFKYGIAMKNELNTFKDTYTKDLISDPSVTIKMVLSEEEMETILEKMLDIDFFTYPDNFSVQLAPDSRIMIRTPYAEYYFKVEYEGNLKELWWDEEIVWQEQWLKDLKDKVFIENKEEVEKLSELISLIRNIIENKEEYKELPKPRGAYI